MVWSATCCKCCHVQASSFQSGEVVATLKAALLPDGSTNTMTFSSEDQVLAYLGNQIIQPIWKDPICGDNKCEAPWEFPAWGPFGCEADCGLNPNTTKVPDNNTLGYNSRPATYLPQWVSASMHSIMPWPLLQVVPGYVPTRTPLFAYWYGVRALQWHIYSSTA